MSATAIKDLGEPVKLGIGVAADVAWRSVKVRVSRSLVTLSSVVLAVAFLVVVIANNIASQSVWEVFQERNREREETMQVKSLAKRARDRRDLLQFYRHRPEIAATWAAANGHELPALDQDKLDTLVTMTDWIEGLEPNQQYVLVRTDGIIEHLLALREPEPTSVERQVAEKGGDPAKVAPLLSTRRFLFESHNLTGVLQPVSDEAFRAMARSHARFAAFFAALESAEAERMAKIAAAGGSEAVLAALDAESDPEQLAAMGLPLRQILPAVNPERLAGIAEHIEYQRRLARLGAILGRSRIRPDPEDTGKISYAKPLPVEDYLGGRLSKHPCQTTIAADIDLAWAEILGKTDELAAVLSDHSRPDGDALDLDSYRERGLAVSYDKNGPVWHPDREAIEAGIAEVLGTPFGPVLERLRRYNGLDALETTFKRKGYDPESSGQRAFWLLVLSFLVCVVGIVNSMTMAVTERFREIATMKCLGAVDSFILQSFMIESGSIGMIGALLGCVAGILISILRATIDFGGYFWASLPLGELGLAVLFALACGLVLTMIGALLPAYKAARMHPIEAMRLEG